jgi:hypothetical protein
VRSAPGQGSCFTIELPRWLEDRPPRAAQADYGHFVTRPSLERRAGATAPTRQPPSAGTQS